ncbi:hypothetical protein GGR50DRAFT_701485 [Xylaria sp. CBS 124048]|nr:hypothetical protein GGR50DRAFT_701485 [Xylaria sp. CBS 124048]
MAADPFEPRHDRRGSIMDAREPSVAAPGFHSNPDTTIRRLFELQADIHAQLNTLLPNRYNSVELDMLRYKLRALETYARNQHLSGNMPVLSEIEEARSLQYRCECIESYLLDEGHDLYDPRILDALMPPVPGEAPAGYTLWLEQNISFYDPVFRGWRARGSAPAITRRPVSFKCWVDHCIYQIYGFSKAEDRDEHMKQHANAIMGEPGRSTKNVLPPTFPDQAQPRSFAAGHFKRSLPAALPRLSVPSGLPGLINQSSDRRSSVSGYPTASEFTPQRRGSLQVEPDVDPMLPPLKRSRVGHSRLESIGELRLPRDAGPCLRCKVLGKPCDSRDNCVFCREESIAVGDELWAALGCHRGPLANLADYMLPEALSPRQTHTPVTSPMARRRDMNEYLERTYLFTQSVADFVKGHLDFNDGFWWTEDLATLPIPNPTQATYSKEPRDNPPPVLKVLAASWNTEGVPFQFWELFRLTGFMSESRESEAVQYPILYRAKLLLREILFYDLQQSEPSTRTEVNLSNAQLLPDDMDYDSRNRLIYNCMVQFLQAFEGVTMRRIVLEPKNWLAIFISLCIFSIVRTILADLISTSSRTIPAQTQTSLPISGGAAAMHSVYKALVQVFAWSTPMVLDSPFMEMDGSDRALFNTTSSAIRQGDWLAWGIHSTKDFLLGLGSGYLVDNAGFNGFVRQRTPIYRHVSYTQPAAGESGAPRRSISEWRPIDPWANRSDQNAQYPSYGMSQERRHTVAGPPGSRTIARSLGSPTKLRAPYQRPPLRRVFCAKCNEYPEGFRGEHELRRHTDAKHAALVRRWVCTEPSNPGPNAPQPLIPLSKCKACVNQKKYGAYYNAAAHLRRTHFHPHRSGKASGDWPPMATLKDWMREVRQSIDANENEDSSGEDECDAQMSEEYTMPRQGSVLEGPRLAPAPTQGPLLAPSIPSSLESTVSNSPNTSKVEDSRNRCPIPDCGRVFKDLVAHMLTHQEERPEKCPIETCEYHTKGFARKYDKNRHALTHYKGSMVCPFCPGSGTVYEKAFNRADVFKRHLTAVHNVEQTPPNSRKMTISESGSRGGGDAKCSICQTRFSSAQEFYEHLDDCVLNVIGSTPKVPREQTSTPQKFDQKNLQAKSREGSERGDPLDIHSMRSTEVNSITGSVEHGRETKSMENMDVDSDRGE